jgi:hypothetical protein
MEKLAKLDLIGTGELIDELCERCVPCVFIGKKNEGGVRGESTWYEYVGDKAVCYGLCHQMAYLIENEQEES